MLVVAQVGTECQHLSIPCGEALPVPVNSHTPARNLGVSISRHLSGFGRVGFFSAWHIYDNINLIPKHMLCKEKKNIVSMKSTKEQQLFVPSHKL